MKTVTENQEKMLNYILAHDLSTQYELAEVLECDTRLVRKVKCELIELGFPIGSTHGNDNGVGAGYFFIDTYEKLKLAQAEYKTKALRMLASASKLEENFYRAESGETQTKLV